jgi:hypothetical protein
LSSIRSRILALVTLVLAACTGQTFSSQHPQIAVSPAVVDFGTLASGPPVTRILTVTNSGSATLNIVRTTVTQDSANAFSVPSFPTLLTAGSSVDVTVILTPPAAEGLYGASLLITSNANNAPLYTVPFSARIGIVQDAGPADAGDTDAGPIDSGFDAGPIDSGFDAGPIDSGFDAGPIDSGFDAGPEDSGFDAGPIDSGFDAGPEDAGADAGSEDGGVDGGVCPAGLTDCDGVCTDLQRDRYNCGMCAHTCFSSSQTCVEGSCGACQPTTGYTVLASGQGLPYDLAVDATTVFWAAETDATIAKVSVNGGATTTIASTANVGSTFQPTNLTIDATSVYFANQTGYVVEKVGRNGGGVLNLGGNGAWPSRIAVNAAGVFWLTSTTGTLFKSPLNGGVVTTLAVADSDHAGEQFELIGVDTTDVYWMAKGSGGVGGAILKVPFAGGTPTTVLADVSWPRDGKVDTNYVYWSSSVNGTIMKVPSSGGLPVTLASHLNGPRNLVIDDTAAYFSVGGTDGSLTDCDGSVQKVGLNGGPVVSLVFGQYSAWAVGVDATSLYWSDLYGGQIMKIAK